MKYLKLNWKLRTRPTSFHASDIAPGIKKSPTLPPEIWRKILSFSVRLSSGCSVHIDSPFLPSMETEEDIHIDPGVFTDRINLALVSSSWRSIVQEISAEYLVIRSAKELKYLVKAFEPPKGHRLQSTRSRLGEWTRRIDFMILGPYKIAHVIRLLKRTPNLLIYNNGNGPLPSAHGTIQRRFTAPDVLETLVTHCGSSLQRIEWSSAWEAPRYQDLVHCCNALPNLVTLRLVAIHSFPAPSETDELLCLPKVKTLSLGIIPYELADTHNLEFALTWDPFLQNISLSSCQLPSLERFDCDIFPRQPMAFFHMHGHKVQQFRTTAWSVGSNLLHVHTLFPSLQCLVIAQCSEIIELPAAHATLEKICIIPTKKEVVEVPPRIFAAAVVDPLDHMLESVESMTAPRLVEVRVRDEGIYCNLGEYSAWLSSWAERFRVRGVNFFNKTGVLYGNSPKSISLPIDSDFA